MTERLRTGRPTRLEAAQIDDRIRQSAVDAILERGFDGTTMESVALAAGVTKRTLYARYSDKQALFAAVIPWAMARLHWEEPPDEAVDNDLESALLAAGRSALARVLHPDVVRLTRLAMIDAARFPDFATSAQSLTFSPRVRSLMKLLQRHIDNGEIVVDDLELAAEDFLALVSSTPATLAAFGVLRTPKEEKRHLEHAVGLFLRGVLAR